MEIERKFLVNKLPDDLDAYDSVLIEQAYLCTDPVIRIRKEDRSYYLTCKGSGLLAREECNLPMQENAYRHLLTKAEGTVISKRRYRIPLSEGITVELDLFQGEWAGLIIAEVEFPDLESAQRFSPPSWFREEVTYDHRYHNSWMSSHNGDPSMGGHPG